MELEIMLGWLNSGDEFKRFLNDENVWTVLEVDGKNVRVTSVLDDGFESVVDRYSRVYVGPILWGKRYKDISII